MHKKMCETEIQNFNADVYRRRHADLNNKDQSSLAAKL